MSDDNPYSESLFRSIFQLFRTLKYSPSYPNKLFENLNTARVWVFMSSCSGYNTEHRHSSIRYVTPSQRHVGLDIEILAKREAVYKAAKASNS